MPSADLFLREFAISPALIAARGLVAYTEPEQLVLAETDPQGRELFLTPATNAAWQQLRAAAASDGVTLILVSAFRSLARQAEIIRQKLARGQALDDILQVNAPPGFSEHHSGRAIDLSTPGVPALEWAFEHSLAFAWLSKEAPSYGFHLSFPRHNRQGFLYEPWHWCFQPDE